MASGFWAQPLENVVEVECQLASFVLTFHGLRDRRQKTTTPRESTSTLGKLRPIRPWQGLLEFEAG